ncbi:hypothetical protein [Sinorhizobium sp. BG8]|uniref:hypothetical protein n=1 Tax=Sinorhizobium sp. BG8 TaxID=2613773 RepID=UPI00193D719B|nr:hypothetical protein [Sinorhizobium sp. BG8]QRM55307.1 hypothetical protein F3Y30_12765 [Sinorhizobium sp. BG8]
MPKIMTTLNELRHSGRMCPTGWATILAGLNKTKGDDAPLDVLHCLPICGHHDTLWHLPNWPQHDMECRSLALSCASRVVHMANDERAHALLALVEKHVAGTVSFATVWEGIPSHFRQVLHERGRDWETCSQSDAAICAATVTAMREGCATPYFAAIAAETAEGKAGGQAQRAAEARHTAMLHEFLSQE